MAVTQYPIKGKPIISIDVIGGHYRIATHSQKELLIDARKTHNKAILPKVEMEDDKIQIGRQPLMRWFVTKLGVECRVLIPEGSVLVVKIFSGELVVTGEYNTVDVRMRNGNVVLEGPNFDCKNSSSIKIVNGNLRCHRLSEAGYNMSLLTDKINEVINSNDVPITVQLNMGELDFS